MITMNFKAKGAAAKNSTERISRTELENVMTKSGNDTASKRASEIIYEHFSSEDRAEMTLTMRLVQDLIQGDKLIDSSIIEKDYESVESFLEDMEMFDLWNKFESHNGFYEDFYEDGISWSMILELKNGETVMKQIVDFIINLDMEE